MAHLMGLEHIAISNLKLNISPGDVTKVLREVLQKSSILESLDLREVYIDGNDHEFYEALANNTTIKRLCLDRNTIDEKLSKCLAHVLGVNTTIERFILAQGDSHINGTVIGHDNIKIHYLANLLKETTALVAIYIDYCGIKGECVEIFADAVKNNKRLGCFVLIGHEIDIDVGGWVALMSLVIENHSLKLSLNNEIITYNGRKFKKSIARKCNVSESLVDWLRRMSKSHRIEMNNIKRDYRTIDKKIEEKIESEWGTEKEKNNNEIDSLNSEVEKKNKEIASLKSAIRGSMEQFNMIPNPVNLTNDEESELPATKRPRTETSAMSNLAILHQQNQKLVRVKKDKNDTEAQLKVAIEEKEATKAELEETEEDLEIANETVQQQVLATDIWQRRFDELAALVNGKVDGAAVAAIRNRSLADQH